MARRYDEPISMNNVQRTMNNGCCTTEVMEINGGLINIIVNFSVPPLPLL
jgi:hypothetical protein